MKKICLLIALVTIVSFLSADQLSDSWYGNTYSEYSELYNESSPEFKRTLYQYQKFNVQTVNPSWEYDDGPALNGVVDKLSGIIDEEESISDLEDEEKELMRKQEKHEENTGKLKEKIELNEDGFMTIKKGMAEIRNEINNEFDHAYLITPDERKQIRQMNNLPASGLSLSRWKPSKSSRPSTPSGSNKPKPKKKEKSREQKKQRSNNLSYLGYKARDNRKNRDELSKRLGFKGLHAFGLDNSLKDLQKRIKNRKEAKKARGTGRGQGDRKRRNSRTEPKPRISDRERRKRERKSKEEKKKDRQAKKKAREANREEKKKNLKSGKGFYTNDQIAAIDANDGGIFKGLFQEATGIDMTEWGEVAESPWENLSGMNVDELLSHDEQNKNVKGDDSVEKKQNRKLKEHENMKETRRGYGEKYKEYLELYDGDKDKAQRAMGEYRRNTRTLFTERGKKEQEKRCLNENVKTGKNLTASQEVNNTPNFRSRYVPGLQIKNFLSQANFYPGENQKYSFQPGQFLQEAPVLNQWSILHQFNSVPVTGKTPFEPSKIEVTPGQWEPPGKQPINFYIGNTVHRNIGNYYMAVHSDHDVYTNSSPINTILKDLGLPGAGKEGLLRPDILNVTTGEYYEIKPINMEPEEVLKEVIKKSIIMTTYGLLNVKPGSSTDPGTFGVVPAPAGYAVFMSPVPGVILYKYKRKEAKEEATITIESPTPDTDPESLKKTIPIVGAGAAITLGALLLDSIGSKIAPALTGTGFILDRIIKDKFPDTDEMPRQN